MNVLERTAWRPRDSLAAAALFLTTAGFTLWQNTRVAVLWDISFLLDTAWRFSRGQLPYRDLPFSYAPLTFLIHTAILQIFGRVYLPHMLYAVVAGALATLLTWRILLRLLRPYLSESWVLALLLAIPLTVLGIYGVYPHPIYDSDCVLAILVVVFLLQRASDSTARHAFAGAAAVLPLFFKQNIGLPFLLGLSAAVCAIAISRKMRGISSRPQFAFLAAVGATLGAATLALHLTVRIGHYFYWTITFAAQRRLPGLGVILGIYRQTSLLWSIPAAITAIVLLKRSFRGAKSIAVTLLAAPFLWTLASLLLTTDPSDRADQFLALWPHILLVAAAVALANLRDLPTFETLLPLILLATIHGTFLSQQLWGSTYAIWPLLVILLATMLPRIAAVALPTTGVIATTLMLCGALYATSHDRLSYSYLDTATLGPPVAATLPALRGMATPGPWIPAFEDLVRFTQAEIPAGDGILLIPGQDPFYFATGRTPHFPILLFDPATNPYSPAQVVEEARSHDIRWLIVNRNLQLTADPSPNLPAYVEALRGEFSPYRTLPGYDIYRRRLTSPQ